MSDPTRNAISNDRLALIRIEGMHCHRCERTIREALGEIDGVREVEVDFASGQASVLFENGKVTARQLMQAVDDAGYRANNFVLSERAHG